MISRASLSTRPTAVQFTLGGGRRFRRCFIGRAFLRTMDLPPPGRPRRLLWVGLESHQLYIHPTYDAPIWFRLN